VINDFEEFFIKWFMGPLRLDDYRFREVARTIGSMKLKRPRFERNYVTDWVGALTYVKEYYRVENLYLSVAFYSEPRITEPKYQWLFYDFDYEENPDLAMRKALEFAESLKRRYGVDVVLIKSGHKGAHIVVPLKCLIDFKTYEYIWHYLVQPYDFSLVLDKDICEARRLQRIPYTLNIKPGRKALAKIVNQDLKVIYSRDFDWSNYEPLNPRSIPFVKVVSEIPVIKEIRSEERVSETNKASLPRAIEELINCEAIPLCIRSIIEAMVKVGDLDHYQRLVLVWFLKWIGYGVEDVVDFFRRCAKDFNERITRYQVEYGFGLRGSRKNWLMPSCEWMKQHGLCLNCGWSRNPVTYTYRRATIPNELIEKFYALVKNHA